MKKLVLASLTCAGLVALLPETGLAHGGQYRGPGDVVPPSPGGGRGTGGPSGPTTGGPAGPSTPGPGGPSTPGPSGPATGGPAGPGPAKGPTTGGRGIQLEDDLTRWEFWWEFNKDPFIRLKQAIQTGAVQTGSDEFFLGATRRVEAKDSLKPSDEDVLNNILPALKKAIDSTDQRDINSSCMAAMAKVGKDHPDFKLTKDVFAPRLTKGDQEIVETAALSIGIAALADEDSINLLSGLALDTEAGRKACAKGEVNERTRAFATYGLGLVAYRTSNTEVKKKVFETAQKLLADDKLSSRNIKVAAINALSLLNIGADGDKALLDETLKALTDYYMKPLGAGEQLIQSHCPTAIAKLLGRSHERSGEYKKLFAADLQEKGKVKRSNDTIFMSCALALGSMALPYEDEKSEDAEYSKLLLESWRTNKNEQTRYFSILALGQIGGAANRDNMIKEFDKGGKALEKPWAAIAMGVYAFNKIDAAKAAGRTPEPERGIGETLRKSMAELKNPSALSGIAVALGLAQYKDAADDIRSMLQKKVNEDELAGYLCIGLALMNDDRSKEEIRSIVAKSVRRPDLLKQASIALGKLGDKGVADQLLGLLNEGDANLAKLSAIASALGFIGDRRTIEPLKKLLFDDKLTELSRAFAAVALGGVADKEDLPWNSKIGTNLNYRASVETLTDKTAGILDIL